MRIPGYFNRRFWPPAPFIRTTLESKSLKIRRPLHFHIDTGASVSVLLDKDASYLGIDVRELKRAERSLGGLGGTIDTHVIEDASLFLVAEEEEVVEETVSIRWHTRDAPPFIRRKSTGRKDAIVTRKRHNIQVQTRLRQESRRNLP